MTLLEQFIGCMQKGDPAALADLFCEEGVLHDSSPLKLGADTLHLEGKMAVEMMYHHKFGFNGGPYPITGVRLKGEDSAWYFVQVGGKVVAVTAILSEVVDGKINRINVYPL